MRAVIDYNRERLRGENAVLLLLDHQVGPLWEPYAARLRQDVGNLATVAVRLGMPAIVSATSCDAWGPIIPELKRVLPRTASIRRAAVNAWHVPRVRGAVEATGRRYIILAGVCTEGCVASTAVTAADSGYRVAVVLDASGHFKETEATTAIARMVQAGVSVTTIGALVAELTACDASSNPAEWLALPLHHRLPPPPRMAPMPGRFTGDAA